MNNNDAFNIIQQDGNNNMAESKKRKRGVRACDLCRRKKVKCHFKPGEPCLNCIAYDETCLFTKESKKRGPPKGPAAAMERRLQKLENNLHQQLDNPKTKPLRTASTTTLQQQSCQQVPDKRIHTSSTRQQQKEQRQQQQRVRQWYDQQARSVQELDSLPSRQWPPGIPYDSVYYLGEMTDLQILSGKIKLDDNSKWNGHCIKRFGDKIVLVADTTEEEKKYQSGNKIPHFQWNHVAPGPQGIHGYVYSCTGVDQYTAIRLLKIYFANVHPILPVINKIEFLKQYRDETATYPSGELLNAMFGAAARFVECEYLEPNRTKTAPKDSIWDIPMGWSDRFFDQAQDIVSRWTANPTASKIQAIVLIHNHRGNLDSKSSACWLMGGFALRLAQMLGLHRNCDDWDIPDGEKETRKRLWWALYVSDRFQSALQGKPLSIQDEDIDVGHPDVCAPWKEVLDELPEEYNGTIRPRFPSATYQPQNTNGKVEIYQLFVQFVKLSEILGRIIQGLHSPRAQRVCHYEHDMKGLVTGLDHELTEWRFSFSKALRQSRFDDFDEDTGYFTPVTASMLLFYFSALILLHRPFIQLNAAGQPISKTSFSSFQICTSAATRGIRIASRLTIHDFLLCPYSFSLYPVMQCCLIHIYNTQDADPQIAKSAQLDLNKGMDLLSHLQDMSSTAKRLNILLRNIIDGKHIIPRDIRKQFNADDIGSNNNIDTTGNIPSSSLDLYPQHSPTTEASLGQNSNQPYPPSINPILWANSSVSSFLDTNMIQDWHISSTSLRGSTDREHQYRQHTHPEAFTLKQFGLSQPDESDINQHENTIVDSGLLPDGIFSNHGASIESSAATCTPCPPIFSSEYDHSNPFMGLPSSMNWDEWDEWFERTISSHSA